MLVSHKHKFITIDIPKTGTTSINNVLSSFMQENDFNCSMSRKVEMRHGTYAQCIKKFPSCKNYLSFTFTRNPWDRLVSYWVWEKYMRIINKDVPLINFLLEANVPDQYLYITGFGDNSFVGRFENLQQEFDIVCDKIGIPCQQLPHLNATKHKHYTEYYDDETRKIVAKKYAKDIEYFGYKFGE